MTHASFRPLVFLLVSAAGCAGGWTGFSDGSAAHATRRDTNLSYARLCERQGHTEQAVHAYLAAISKDPRNQVAYHRLGVMASRRGEFKQAVAYLRKAKTVGPAGAELLTDLGYALLKHDQPHEAEIAFLAALDRRPDDRRARIHLGVALVRQGRRDDGLLALKQVLPPGEATQRVAGIVAQSGGSKRGDQVALPGKDSHSDARLTARTSTVRETLSKSPLNAASDSKAKRVVELPKAPSDSLAARTIPGDKPAQAAGATKLQRPRPRPIAVPRIEADAPTKVAANAPLKAKTMRLAKAPDRPAVRLAKRPASPAKIQLAESGNSRANASDPILAAPETQSAPQPLANTATLVVKTPTSAGGNARSLSRLPECTPEQPSVRAAAPPQSTLEQVAATTGPALAQAPALATVPITGPAPEPARAKSETATKNSSAEFIGDKAEKADPPAVAKASTPAKTSRRNPPKVARLALMGQISKPSRMPRPTGTAWSNQGTRTQHVASRPRPMSGPAVRVAQRLDSTAKANRQAPSKSASQPRSSGWQSSAAVGGEQSDGIILVTDEDSQPESSAGFAVASDSDE